MTPPRVALVTGATGQDGFFLAQRLVSEGCLVHAVGRRDEGLAELASVVERSDLLVTHQLDLLDAGGVRRLILESQPDEIYNLAGQSSVGQSFAKPVDAWRSNAEAVVILLEAVRLGAPSAKFYQASSGEMFGWSPRQSVVHDERSAFAPQSPYAAAKAAAHLECRVYRSAFGLRVACGILFNHESHRRPGSFLTRKVVDHVQRLRRLTERQLRDEAPLRMGNLAAERDWGFAPDYVEGMVLVLRQLEARAAVLGRPQEPDEAGSYRDYVLATGQLHAVWELVDVAFRLAGLELEWERGAGEVRDWRARLRATGSVAVVVDPDLLRPADPVRIQADPTRACTELGWVPKAGLEQVLEDMLAHGGS